MKSEGTDRVSIKKEIEGDKKNVQPKIQKEEKHDHEHKKIESIPAEEIPMPYEAKVALIVTVGIIAVIFLVFFVFAFAHMIYLDDRSKIYLRNPFDEEKFMSILRSEKPETKFQTFLQNLKSFLEIKTESSFKNPEKSNKKDTIMIFVPDFFKTASSFDNVIQSLKQKNDETGSMKNLEMISFSYRGQGQKVPEIAEKMGFPAKIKKTRVMDAAEDLEHVVNSALREHDKKMIKMILVGEGFGGFVIERYLQLCFVNANCPDAIVKIGSIPLQRTKYFWSFLDFPLLKSLYSKENMLLAYVDYVLSRLVDEKSISVKLWQQKKDAPAIKNCVSLHFSNSSAQKAWNGMELIQFSKAKPFFCANARSTLIPSEPFEIAEEIESVFKSLI